MPNRIRKAFYCAFMTLATLYALVILSAVLVTAMARATEVIR